MRTTLTLEDDVAAQLDHLRRMRRSGLKEIVNEALRRGLREMATDEKQPEAYQTPSVSLGKCLIGSIDDVAETLAIAEGEKPLSSLSSTGSSA